MGPRVCTSHLHAAIKASSSSNISMYMQLSCINLLQFDHIRSIRNKTHSNMASGLTPAFAYTVVYVTDVAKSTDFYAKAFGYNVRRVDESHRWGELESGRTTIAFTPMHQHETDDLSGQVKSPRAGGERTPVEVCFTYADVDAAYKRAVENGAVGISAPEDKEWGQRVGYVRDIDGIVVRMGSHVNPPKH